MEGPSNGELGSSFFVYISNKRLLRAARPNLRRASATPRAVNSIRIVREPRPARRPLQILNELPHFGKRRTARLGMLQPEELKSQAQSARR